MEELIKSVKEIITKDGIKVSGNGIVIKKLEAIEKLTDKQNLKLYYLEKRLEEIKKLLEEKLK